MSTPDIPVTPAPAADTLTVSLQIKYLAPALEVQAIIMSEFGAKMELGDIIEHILVNADTQAVATRIYTRLLRENPDQLHLDVALPHDPTD
jgi:hypothetical protein